MTAPLVGAATLRAEGVSLELPQLADNGYVVPLRVRVDSPMTEAQHVTQIWLLSQRNPVTRMAVFHLGPWSGRAEIATRVRLAGTQTVVALARLSNGEFRMAQAEVVVTESACLDAG
jgi:sulfur-oxidizing protein SoxY